MSRIEPAAVFYLNCGAFPVEKYIQLSSPEFLAGTICKVASLAYGQANDLHHFVMVRRKNLLFKLIKRTGIAMVALLLLGWMLVTNGYFETSVESEKGAVVSQPAPVSTQDPDKSPGQKLLDAVPDGGSISYDDLKKAVGDDVANLFAWAKPKKISRKGNHFVLECEPGATVSAGGITLNLDQTVEADLTVHPDGVQLSKVKGATVSWAGFNLLKVRDVRIQRDGTDKVKVSGKAEVSWLLPYVPFSVTLSEDDMKK